jgi:hypothetical protein
VSFQNSTLSLPTSSDNLTYSVTTDDINYSAIAGGDRQAALDAASKDLEVCSNVASIDLMNIEKPDSGSESPPAGVIVIPDLRAQLPYIMSRGRTTVKRMELYLKSKTDPDGLKSVTAMINGTESDREDAPMGAFVIEYYEGSIVIADSWKVDLKLESAAWQGELDEAWLLISYAVTGLV